MVRKVRPRCCFNGRVDGEAVGKGRHSAKCLEVAKDRELHAKRGGEASARVGGRLSCDSGWTISAHEDALSRVRGRK
jgi:hypothetical protein